MWLVEFPDDPKSRPAPTHVLLHAGQGGLSHDSMARCENFSYLHKSRLSRDPLAAAVSPALMRDIERGLLRSLGITA